MTVNGDLSLLPAMSVQLRHKGPDTTSEYYAAIDRSVAVKQLREACSKTPLSHNYPDRTDNGLDVIAPKPSLLILKMGCLAMHNGAHGGI